MIHKKIKVVFFQRSFYFIQIKHFINFKYLVLFFFIAAFSCIQSNAQFNDSTIHFINLFDKDSSENISCFRIPSLITAPNGDLIAAVDERVPSCGDLKWSKDINIVIRRSTDNGATWLPLQTVVNYPFGQSASDPSMIVDKVTGEIFLFFNYMDLENEKDIYYLRYSKSKDNGHTWSESVDITKQINKTDWQKDFKFITSGRGMQTVSGKLVHTIVNLQKGLFVFESNDHGKNWKLIDNAIKPADESQITEPIPGHWIINSRVNDGMGMRYIHSSTDEGKTWKAYPDSSLADPGCNAGLLNYSFLINGMQTNLLLFSNAFSKKDRENMTISVSDDAGKTWLKHQTIFPGSAAYSSITQLSNGDIGLLFEKDDYGKIVFVSIPIQYLLSK